MRSFLAAAAVAMLGAVPAHADWLFLQEPNPAGPGNICSVGYETDEHAMLFWADSNMVAAILIDVNWTIEDGYSGWAGLRFGDGKNNAFQVQKSNDNTVFAVLEDDLWVPIIAAMAEDKSGTLVTPMAKVWMLPKGAAESTAEWVACIAGNIS